jgi:hypothetical protein
VVSLNDVLPLELLNLHLENGVIRRQVHPDFPELSVYNYTEQAQFNRIWDAATNVCRGLIVANGAVIARGFNKFHNLNTAYAPETLEENLPKGVPLVTTKLDGSLGILFSYAGGWHVATRGSFASTQAQWATAWYRRHLRSSPASWPEGATPVFEVIYPENRIVVTYEFEGLVLLGAVDNRTGEELDRRDVESYGRANGLHVVEKFDKSLAECAAEDVPNEEGYVLTYSNGVKVKVKFAEYVRLHRILTGLNPKAIWELLAKKQDTTVSSWLEDPKMPVTFKAWLSGWVAQLRARYAEAEDEAKAVFALKPSGTRKDDAMFFQQTKHLAGVLFLMLDGKNYEEMIWGKIRPKATDTFKEEGQ